MIPKRQDKLCQGTWQIDCRDTSIYLFASMDNRTRLYTRCQIRLIAIPTPQDDHRLEYEERLEFCSIRPSSDLLPSITDFAQPRSTPRASYIPTQQASHYANKDHLPLAFLGAFYDVQQSPLFILNQRISKPSLLLPSWSRPSARMPCGPVTQ